MEGKEPIKVNLSTVIFIIVIIILIMLLGGMYFYYNYVKVVLENSEINNTYLENNDEKINDNIDEEDELSIYEKYPGLYWQFKDNEMDKTNIEFGNKEIKIENGKAYLYAGNSKVEIDEIEGKAKFVNTYGEQTLERVYILTEEGTIWKSICENGLNSSFTKVDLNEKVIDMTNGNASIQVVEPPYFLLANGELVNEEERSYNDSEEKFVKSLGNSASQVFIKADNTMYIYDYEKDQYIQIKEENGKPLKMKDAFIQWSSIYNDLVSVTGGEERIFAITEQGKLVYFDGYSEIVAKEYKESIGKTVKSTVEEKQEVEFGHILNTRITFTDGSEIVLKDARRNFFEN